MLDNFLKKFKDFNFLKPKPKKKPVESKPVEKEPKVKDTNNNLKFILSKLDPITIFPNNIIAAKFWCVAFFVMTFIAIIEPIPYFVMINNRERVLVMDGSGEFGIAPLTDYKNATPLHYYIAKEATKVLLDRNPNGFDSPEELRQLYIEPMYELILKQFEKTKQEFVDENIHQKCEVQKVDMLKKPEGYILVQTKGQLIRSGQYKSQSFTDVYKFILELKLVKNPSIGNNFRLPYAVSWFNIKIKKKAQGEN